VEPICESAVFYGVNVLQTIGVRRPREDV